MPKNNLFHSNADVILSDEVDDADFEELQQSLNLYLNPPAMKKDIACFPTSTPTTFSNMSRPASEM